MEQQAVRIASTRRGGVFVAVDGILGAVVGPEEGGDWFGRVATAWVNVRGGMRVFSVYFWHSERWVWRDLGLASRQW